MPNCSTEKEQVIRLDALSLGKRSTWFQAHIIVYLSGNGISCYKISVKHLQVLSLPSMSPKSNVALLLRALNVLSPSDVLQSPVSTPLSGAECGLRTDTVN